MIVIAKAADVLIQPRVLKVGLTFENLGIEYKIIGIASENVKIKKRNKLVIHNIRVRKTIIYQQIRSLHRLAKLIKYFSALYNIKANNYYVQAR